MMYVFFRLFLRMYTDTVGFGDHLVDSITTRVAASNNDTTGGSLVSDPL